MAVQATAPRVRLGLHRPRLLLMAAVQLINQTRLFDAEALLGRVLEAEPEDATAWSCLGSLKERFGDIDGSLAAFERATAAAPDDPRILSNQIFALDRHPSVTLDRAAEVRRRYNGLVARPPRPHANDRDPDRILRVGYVSGDVRQHSAAFGFGPVLLKHDPSVVEVTVYSVTPETDWLTEAIRSGVPRWRECVSDTDDELEARIRADRIDILVDLSGHSAGNRLPVFARKPAPIQVTAWGYPTGTGLDAVDYLFSDDVCVTPDEERSYAETIVRLPRVMTFWPPDPSVVGDVGPLPLLANGYMTFGVFQRLGKLHPGCLALWARVLAAVSDSRLVVKAPGLEREDVREQFAARLEGAGIERERVALLGSTPHPEHVRAYGQIDLLLDPWPDGGGISTLEAAWMGVPTLTAPWHQVSSRAGMMVNRELGLESLIALNPTEYVERAVAASEQAEELADIRRWMRDLMIASAFGSHALYTRHVERHYRAFWRTWIASSEHPTPQPTLRLVAPEGAP
jgi:predicted O-linked N-acetylglucosamine transferase (SPINDLY family)